KTITARTAIARSPSTSGRYSRCGVTDGSDWYERSERGWTDAAICNSPYNSAVVHFSGAQMLVAWAGHAFVPPKILVVVQFPRNRLRMTRFRAVICPRPSREGSEFVLYREEVRSTEDGSRRLRRRAPGFGQYRF